MANTHHTGIPKLQWVGAYPPCTPSASISVDLSPFCAGDSVMFTPTLNCVENVIIASQAWVVNGVIKSTSPDPFVTTELLNNDKVYFFFIANENPYFSNVITVVEKTEGCEPEPEPIRYGLLYNWYAATDARNIAADGWEVPTGYRGSNFATLITYIGGSLVGGGKLKETGSTYWDTPNTGATNEIGFNARGGSYRGANGSFGALKYLLYLATKTISAPGNYFGYELRHYNSIISVAGTPYNSGYYIRLIKTTTTLTHGQTGTYTGNDGKVYRTICIGTQEWLADNLCETKYRNGDTIPEVTDNSAWAALTTGALCAYDNDWSNV